MFSSKPKDDDDTGNTFVRNLREKLAGYGQPDADTIDADPEWLPDCTGIHVVEHNRMADMNEEDQSVIMALKDTHRIHIDRLAGQVGKRDERRTVDSKTFDGKAFDTVRVKALKLEE